MIHPTAIIDESAIIGADVTIGPWTLVGPGVEIGDGCNIGSHVVIKGPTKMGRDNQVFQFATIGEDCQDKKYDGEPTTLSIGDRNVFRECTTIHRGTVQDIGTTVIGSDNLFMVGAHVAHDCVIGNFNIFANNCAVAGHVHVGDWVIMGGNTGIHQFVHIGSHVFLGAGSIAVKDIPPYVMAAGEKATPHGVNSEGLKRRGFTVEGISAIKKAYKIIYRQGRNIDSALVELKKLAEEQAEIEPMVEFLSQSNRGIIR